MIGVTKLYCGAVTPSEVQRYGRDSSNLPSHLLQFSEDKRPVVVWNCTKTCNLKCVHCYASATAKRYEDQLTTEEGINLIDDLAEFKVPTLLFSGGEPFLRKDLLELMAHGIKKGIRCIISTNGTLIDEEAAARVKEAGVSYVGISVDGSRETHDRFRGVPGSYDRTMKGIQHCLDAGIKVGLRFTVNKMNKDDLPMVIDMLEEKDIPRLCIYHLAYAGRGNDLRSEDLTHEETRKAVDYICQRTKDFVDRGMTKEVLTVDNHADAVWIYLKVKKEQPERAEEVYKLLQWNGGNSAGVGIASVDYRGDVHADQFWVHHSFGNVRERRFQDIWTDTSEPLMAGLKKKKEMVKGRCAKCKFLEVCGGNLRVRAEAVYGDVWAPDPACYLTDEEIGIA